MPTYLIRLAQAHESFRKVELQALAELAGVELEFIKYEENVGNSICQFIIVLSTSTRPP
jgi:tRNA G10  N-methylase Trm11